MMDQLMFIQTGMGTDVHGQDITKAAVRAIKNAIHTNSMPGIRTVLPEQSLENMKINVKLALPCDHDKLDYEEVRKAIPYGDVQIKVMDGGMLTSSGIFLEDKEDKNDLMYIVNAAIEVGY
ncbi:Lin0512 family protein [Halobacillus locisalis]|uniref:Lin0512 family protein n=1 Tax=Halobacillus locisalis TaxID=220753 RepID=A0A838CXN5_9BACI|nr:Lin0512 family protein [Halobacillus locisalis]MBA2176525.1 Lin0512 family protein [Halobacillus locisalis]